MNSIKLVTCFFNQIMSLMVQKSQPPPLKELPSKSIGFQGRPFPFFCAGENISLVTILPLALSLVERKTFSPSFFHLLEIQIWSQDDKSFIAPFSNYISRIEKCPPLYKCIVRKSPCPFLCLQRNNLPCHRFSFIRSLKPSSIFIFSAKRLLRF